MQTILVYCWGSASESMTIEAMKKAGYQVLTCARKIKDYHADAEFAQQFMQQLHLSKANIVFSYDYFPLVSMICEMNGVPYASWVYDCPQYGLLSKTVTNSYNHIFCFDALYARRLQNLGAQNVYHFPLATDTNMYESAKKNRAESSYACDISFVGSLYNGDKNRLLHTKLSEYAEGYIEGLLRAQKEICGYNLVADALMEQIAKEVVEKCGIVLSDVYVWDTTRMAADAINMKMTALDREEVLSVLAEYFETNDMVSEEHPCMLALYTNSELPNKLIGKTRLICKGTVDYLAEMPLVFHNSKINLNITSRTIESGVPQRVFDILACGGFCLTNYQPEIADLFEDGKELVMYTDTKDLLQKVEYYLNCEEERLQIAQAGQEKVRNCFSIEGRIAELINSI